VSNLVRTERGGREGERERGEIERREMGRESGKGRGGERARVGGRERVLWESRTEIWDTEAIQREAMLYCAGTDSADSSPKAEP
jgi:hypothetical protein